MRSQSFQSGLPRTSAATPTDLVLLIMVPTVLSWVVMVVLPQTGLATSLCLAPRVGLSEQAFASVSIAVRLLDLRELLASAALMSFAMTLPLTWNAACHIRSRSFADQRTQQVLLFLVVALSVGLAFNLLVATLSTVVRVGLWAVLPSHVVAAGLTLLVAFYRSTSVAENLLRRCHRTMPLRAFAPGAWIDAGHFGFQTAISCVRLCWPAMILPWFSNWPVICMLCVTGLALRDRLTFRPTARVAVGAFSCLAVLELLGG